jgi:hypothetical protein
MFYDREFFPKRNSFFLGIFFPSRERRCRGGGNNFWKGAHELDIDKGVCFIFFFTGEGKMGFFVKVLVLLSIDT